MLHRVVVMALTLAQATAATNLTWSSCSVFSDSYSKVADIDRADCTVYPAPLCHPGICETPDSINATMDVFVRRLRSAKVDPKTAPNVWLVQGGISFSPASLDWPIINLYLALNGEANVYTMDYRGTSRGTYLSCDGVQAGSGVSDVDPTHVPACAKELEAKFGDLAAFSTTSAAMDLVTFISEHGNDISTTLYGVGYGTLLVERVMHLGPPEVTGYVLDSVFTTSGASSNKFMNLSSLDAGFGEVADSFLDLCSEDKTCNSRFKKNGLKSTLQHMMTKFDKNPRSTCAKLLTTVRLSEDDDPPPSFGLRYLLGSLLLNTSMRTLIPPIVYRLLRCAPKDVEVLSHLIELLNGTIDPKFASDTPVLDYLVGFSEMWETPTPSIPELKARYAEATMSSWAPYLDIFKYCAFSKEKSPVCNQLKLGDYKSNGIIYDRDEYWNNAAKIPNQASVLLMSSKTDPFAPHKYAKYLLDALDGDKKELITFKYTEWKSRRQRHRRRTLRFNRAHLVCARRWELG